MADKSGTVKNQLLARLSRPDSKRLQAHLELVPLEHRQVLCKAGSRLPHAYFPHSSVVSLLTAAEAGTAIEVAAIGGEGMIGLPVHPSDEINPWEVLVQVPGEALRIATATLREELDRHGSLYDVLSRYASALFTQTGQLLACNALHTVKQRCCRWLLTMQDRAQAPGFPMTQEFLAQMLGVRRASVAEVAGLLQRANLIQSSRGTITIVNRRGIESWACDCHRLSRAVYERLLPAS